MKSYNAEQSKKCPVAQLWGDNSNGVPYCDDCSITNSDEKRTCDEQVAENYKNSMNEKLKEVKAPYLLERQGDLLYPVGVIHNANMKGTWVF